MPTAQLTMLNSMAAADFEEALQIHKEWGIEWLDLRDEIYGNWVKALDVPTAQRAKDAIDAAGLKVFCLSTSIFFADIAKGEQEFREVHLEKLKEIIEVAKVLQPTVVRIIAAQLPELEPGTRSMPVIKEKYPWLVEVYREALQLIADAGLTPTIENEAFRCFLSLPEDFIEFFEWIDRPDIAHLTWDVQNQWATGVFPTLEVYETLKPLIHYYHVKGGQTDGTSDRLVWNVALEDASWPVAEITQAVVNDGVSPVICLNPAQHGEQKPDYNYDGIVKRDVDFLRNAVKGIE
ncbi:MAG TPA: TIM barrel protein [Homoserinimonas sp.]|nr:TIM barrel protein [Homoserinimonas sp.]